MKTACWISIFYVIALGSVLGGGCVGPQLGNAEKLVVVDNPEPAKPQFCVLGLIPENSEWLDAEEEMRIRFSGKSAEYWVDGHRKDPACRWMLQHASHGRGKCVFQCDSPFSEWFVSVGKAADGQDVVRLEKNAAGRPLAMTYEFAPAAKTGK